MQNEMSVEQIIGKRIQKIRRAKGYTQQQFSEMIGLSTNYLSDIERGKSSARLDKLVAIINALECSADDVFSDVINFGYKVKSSRLSERLEALPPEEQEKAFAILGCLYKQNKLRYFNEPADMSQTRFLYSLYFFINMCYTNYNIVIYSLISLL